MKYHDLPGAGDGGLLPALRSLVRQLPRRRKVQALFIIVGSLVTAATETLSIGALVSLLNVMNDVSIVRDNDLLGPYLVQFGLHDPKIVVYTISVGFVVLVILASACRLALTWVVNRWVYGVGYDFGVRVFGNILRQPYAYHLVTPSKDAIVGLDRVSTVSSNVLRPIVSAVAAAIIATGVLCALIWIEPVSAISAMVGFVTIYLLAVFMVRGKLTSNARKLVLGQRERLGLVQDGIGNIRDVILDNNSAVYVQQFRRWDGLWRSCQVVNQTLTAAPRYVIEAIGMTLIVLIALLLMNREGGLAEALPLLGALAMGARKLVPELQRVYLGWTQSLGSITAAYRVLDLLHLELPLETPHEPIPFQQRLAFSDLRYRYPGADNDALCGLDLTIHKGERLGLVGPSGSGKSTLIDVLLGLLSPASGRMEVDGQPITEANVVAWRQNIAHVPQSVFLTDASIAENIALGEHREDIDMDRLASIIEQVKLDQLVRDRADGVWSPVGERGSSLSGGQVQRVAIARALYKRPDVLVLDEATSALDHDTERSIVRCIDDLDADITVIMIAHRLSPLASCSRIVQMGAGRVSGETDYQTLVKTADSTAD